MAATVPAKIFYNTVAQSLGKIFAAGIGLVTIAILSQYLGENGFGGYSTVIAFLGVFVVLADFGLYLYVVREISKPGIDSAKVISNALGLRLTVALASLLAGAAIAWFLPYDRAVKEAIFVCVLAFLFISLNQVLVGIFQKHLAQYLLVISETIGRAVHLILVMLFIKNSLSLGYFIAALLAGNIATFALTVMWARKYERFTIAFDFGFWKEILKNTWPLIFAVVLNLLYFKTDTVILSWFRPQEAVGVYSLPYKILEGLLAFPAMFVGLVMPLLSRSAFNNWGEFKTTIQRSFDALFLMAALAVIIIMNFAREIIAFMKNVGVFFAQKAGGVETAPAYADSADLLRILILSAGTIFLGTLFGYAVVALGQQRAMIKGYLAGAIAGLVLYFLLIPPFGYWGAAWGTLISEIIVAGFAYLLVRKTSGQKISLSIILLTLPAIIGLVLFFQFVNIQWMVEIALGIILYIILLIMFRAIPESFVKEIFRTPPPRPPAGTSPKRSRAGEEGGGGRS